MTIAPKNLLPATFLIFIAVLAGCGQGQEKHSATQVAAKVNGDEVSVHQINNALQRAGAVSEAQAKEASGRILESLIEQQLLVQKAVEAKLDRDPRIVQAVDQAKREILAQAYLQQNTLSLPKSTPSEVSQFYASKPELFSRRRIYRMQQIQIGANAALLPKIQAAIEKAGTQPNKEKVLRDIADWLKGQGIAFQTQLATQAPEQMPLELLAKVGQMKTGDMLFSVQPNGYVVALLTATQDAPIEEKQATPYIEQYLQSRSRVEATQQRIKDLRAAAKIEYMGDFAKVAALAPTSSSAGVPVDAKKSSEKPDQGFVDKGLSGLK